MNNAHLYPHANQYLEFILSLIEQGFTWKQVESAKIMYDSNVDEFIAYIWNGEKVVYADLRPDKKKKVVSDFVAKITEHFMGIIRQEYNVDPSQFPLVKERYAEIYDITYHSTPDGVMLRIWLNKVPESEHKNAKYFVDNFAIYEYIMLYSDSTITLWQNGQPIEDIE